MDGASGPNTPYKAGGLEIARVSVQFIALYPDNRAHFLAQLEDHGYDEDKLNDVRLLVDAQDSDLFDVLSYVLFRIDPATRQDRAGHLLESGLNELHDEMKSLLVSILRVV